MISPCPNTTLHGMRAALFVAAILIVLSHPAAAASGCAPAWPLTRPIVPTAILADGFIATVSGERLRLAALDRATLPAGRALIGTDATFAGSEPVDRHGALRGDLILAGLSYRETLLRAGEARLRPDLPAEPCLDRLRGIEAQARANRLGLWNDPRYAVLDAGDPDAVRAQAGRFVVAIGRVVHVGVRKNRVYVDFGSDWRRDVAAVTDRKSLDGALLDDPTRLAGRLIEVRGVVRKGTPPHIELEAPGTLVVLGHDGNQ